MAQGYAINSLGDGGGILVDTVHTTRRAAIVNWLITRRGIVVTADWDDGAIEMAWRSLRDDGLDYCIKVDITASQMPGANVTERKDG